VAPATPVPVNGPRKGALGIHGSLFGTNLSVTGTTQSSSSALGLRYFVADWVGLNVEAGFALGSVEKQSASSLGVGVGVNLYGDSVDTALRPYFTGGLGLTSVTAGENGLATVSLSAGGGLEYWVLPRLSVDASLLLNLTTSPGNEVFALGPRRPSGNRVHEGNEHGTTFR